eukprot:56650-Eustigmatos_ZCMA.PRE.1
MEGHAGFILLLLQRGADVNAGAGNGATPLVVAVRHRRPNIVGVLLEHGGSEVDAANDEGWTA